MCCVVVGIVVWIYLFAWRVMVWFARLGLLFAFSLVVCVIV